VTKNLIETAGRHDDDDVRRIRRAARWAEQMVAEDDPIGRGVVWVNRPSEQYLDFDVIMGGIGFDVKSVPLGARWVIGGASQPRCLVVVVESDYEASTYEEWRASARVVGSIPLNYWQFNAPEPGWEPCWNVHMAKVRQLADVFADEKESRG